MWALQGLVKLKYLSSDSYDYTTINMTAISNRNVMELVDEFVDSMRSGNKIMNENGESFVDAAVLTETLTMGYLSRRCDHTASSSSNTISYERTPKDSTKISTQLDVMNMEMTTNLAKNLKTRKNPVTSALICGIASMIELAERIKTTNEEQFTIIYTNLYSVTHAATIVFAFRNLRACYDWGSKVELILIVDPDTVAAMNAYIGSIENVKMNSTKDVIMEVFKILNHSDYRNTHVTVYTHLIEIAKMCNVAFNDLNVVINLVTTLKTLSDENVIKRLIEETNSIVEAVPCSDPDENVIRVTPSFLSTDPSKRKFKTTERIVSYYSRLKWFNNMIRHMNLDGVCYDCRIAYKVSSSIANAIVSKDENDDESMIEDPLKKFEVIVGTTGIVDLGAT